MPRLRDLSVGFASILLLGNSQLVDFSGRKRLFLFRGQIRLLILGGLLLLSLRFAGTLRFLGVGSGILIFRNHF